jgi:eukaryotic-like serine/threonine-protein kinase
MSSELWKNWEGQIVDQRYQLRRYLGSTDHSAVFLAEMHDSEPKEVAIKFISADFGNRDAQIAAWKDASNLSHPGLLKIYGAGSFKFEEMDLLYIAMEYAEENLSQVLPSRPLMADEASQVVNSVVDVLVYLHGKDLVHGHVKPSNILAQGELLKLSSDTICLTGQVREMRRERSLYDAPELPGSAYTPAADVWSLGVTLVEALTQQHAVLPFNEQADPIIPETVREPYMEIARQSLRREPRLRWTSAKIAERLNPAATAERSVAAAAGASVRSAGASASTATMATAVATPAPPVMAPPQMPGLNEPGILTARQKKPTVRSRPVMPRAPVVQEKGPRETVVLPNYAIPLFAGALFVVALILLPFVFHHSAAPPESSKAVASVSPDTARSNTTNTNGASNNTQPAAKPSPSNIAPSQPPASSQPQPATSAGVSTASSSAGSKTIPAAKPSNGSHANAKGEVLDKTTPEAAAKALATIHGTVRVGVNVHVDAAGNVADAKLDNSGPSRYFADLSLKAARQWVFTPPEADGHSVASDWKIQFHYTQAGVQMSSEQLTP